MHAKSDSDFGDLLYVTILTASWGESAKATQNGRGPVSVIGAREKIFRTLVEEIGGVVTPSDGAKMVAIFGWPGSMEDHADRACHVAWRIRRAMLQERTEASQLRMGLHSGLVELWRLAPSALEQRAIGGVTPRIAAALEAQAAPGEIYVSDATMSLCRGYVSVAEVAENNTLSFEGRRAFSLVSAPKAPQAAESPNRFRGPMVGRDRELKRIRSFLSAPRGGALALVGEPGMGKSRLLAAAIEEAHRSSLRVVAAFGAAERRHEPLGILRDLAKNALQDRKSGLAADGAEAAGGQLDDMRRSAMLAALSEFEDGERRSAGTRDYRALSDAFGFAVLSGDVTLVVEDLHLVDEDSLRVLRRICRDHAASGVKLLVTARPEARARAADLGAKTLNVKALSDAALTEQAAAMSPGLMLSAETIAEIVTHSGGFPLHLEQGVHAASVADPRSVEGLGSSIDSMVHARLNALDAEVRRVAQHLGALGVGVDMLIAQHVLDLTETELLIHLGPLKEREIVVRGSPGRVEFRHARLAEACASMLSDQSRRQANAKAAAAILDVYGETEEQFGRLAHFEEQAGEYERALHWLILENRRVRKLHAHGAMVGVFERAMACVEKLGPHGVERLPEFANPAFATLIQLGEIDLMRRCLPKIFEASENDEDAKALCAVQCNQGLLAWFEGAFHHGAAISRQALGRARAIGSLPLILTAEFNLATMHFGLGDFSQATDLLEASLLRLEGAAKGAKLGQVAKPHSICRSYLAWIYAERGDFGRAESEAQEALKFALEGDDAYAECLACVAIGRVNMMSGGDKKAADAFAEACAIAERYGYDAVFPGAAGLRLSALARAGMRDEANELLRQATKDRRLDRTGKPERHAFYLGAAEAHLLLGGQSKARSALAKARKLADDMQSPAHLRATDQVARLPGLI